MIIGVPSETDPTESRAALIPPVAADLVEQGFEVLVSTGIGDEAGWGDVDYESAGCELVADRGDIFDRSDVIFQVNGVGAADGEQLDPYASGQLVIGLLGPFNISEEDYETLAEREVTAFSLELIPRISRAQSMDALSSMASIGGYKATIVAAEALPKMLPMEMTAAGTIQPARVFVIGAGVAGLKAIATAERLGGSVRAYDIRPEVKEEVESLGATFVELELTADDASDEEGHAREMDEEFYRKQRQMMDRVVAESDIVITTAAVPGRPSPELVTSEMIDGMKHGSVIVDLAAEGGGNCEPTSPNEIVHYNGVRIFGPTNLPGTVPHHASQLYSNNVNNFFQNLLEDDELTIDTADAIVDSTMLVHKGELRRPHEDDEDGDDDE